MAEITIASYDQAVSPAFTGATATLKIWYDRQFLTSDDEIVLAGDVEHPNVVVACTVGGGGFTVTIPSFTIDSTIDGVPPVSRATAILFDENGIHRETLLVNFKIPDTPTSTTWPALFVYNQGGLVTLPDEYYDKNQVNALLATMTAGGGGGSNTLGMSNLGNTSGTTGVVSGSAIQYFLAGGNNVTLSQSLNGSSGTITISAFNQSVQPIGTASIGMSNLGNTSGTTGVVSATSPQFVFAGGNNVTLSQSLNGSSGTITISAFNQSVQPLGTNTLGMSNIGNTGGDTSIRTGTGMQVVFAGGNNVTLSQSTNGSSATITISAFNQSAQPIGTNTLGMSNIGNTSGDSSIRTGTGMQVVFAGGNNITLSQSTNGSSATITVSAFNQSVQPIGTNTLGMSNIGNTSGDTSIRTGTGIQLVFAGGENITLSQSTNGSSATVTISASNAPAMNYGVSNLGNTSGTSGTVSLGSAGRYLFAGGNNITLSQSIDTENMRITVTVSAFNQSNQSLGLYAVSNTTQSSSGTVDARTLSFQGAGIASVGISNGSVIVSVPTGAPSPVNFSAGTTSNNLASVVFTNANNLSFGLDGSTISASFNPINLGVSTGGNTAGTTGMMDGAGAQVVFVGGNNITLSQSSAASAMTITVSGMSHFTASRYNEYKESPLVVGQQGQATLHLQPWIIPNVQFDRVVMPVVLSNTSNSSGSMTLSAWFGIYTRTNGSISRSLSASTTYAATMSGTVGSYSQWGGPRNLTMGMTNTLTEGQYWLAVIVRSTTGGANMSISQQLVSQMNSNFSGIFGAASAASDQRTLGLGVYSASTTGLPASIAWTEIQGSASLAQRPPAIMLVSGTN